MDWVGVGICMISGMLIYALFSENEEQAQEIEEAGVDHTELEINDFSIRHVTMSCQTCRKLKRHKEIEPNLFQCVKCKRHVDLRAS